MTQVRLQKLLSQWGIASRRQAESLIQSGRVVVNGEIAHLGQRADPQLDAIQLDGRVLSPQNRPDSYYLLLNKPQRVMSSCHDPQGRKTVITLLPTNLQQGMGIHPVGRLDYNSTGALILTNDGALTSRLTHPRHHVPKTYRVWVSGQPSGQVLDRWRQGVILAGKNTCPADVRVISTNSSGSVEQTLLQIILWEGRNRQIRRVAALLGHPVRKLHRVAIGPIKLGSLRSGHIRTLTTAELATLARSPSSAFPHG